MIGSALLNLSEHQWRAIAVTALILLLWCVWSIVRPWLVKVISGVTNVWLCRRYSVRQVEDHTSLPTVPYEFPNGQGDAAKFLHGKANSETWGKQHGSLYRIWSGMTPEVVLTRQEHIQAVFKDSDRHFKAVNNNSGYLLSQILGQCVGLISKDEWKRVRAVCERPFIRSATIKYIGIANQRTNRHFQGLRVGSNLLSQSLIDPAQDLKMLPFWIVADILYGELSTEMEAQLRNLAPLREDLFRHVIRGGLARFHWSKYLPTAANRKLLDFQAQWSAFNLRARDRAIQQGINAPIVQMYEAVTGKILSPEQLLHTLDEMLYANLDVTLGGISWNLVFLAAHADVYDRLRREVMENRQASEKDPTIFDEYLLSSTSFLAACISESSRLRPLAAFSVPQAAPTGRVVGGYFFPAGTNFIVDSYALNQHNPYWGEDATVYRPARFLEHSPVQARYNFWRFGFGPRQCMGKYVADLIIRVLLVHLAERYELGLVKTGKEWEHDPDTWINHPQMQLRCEPRVLP